LSTGNASIELIARHELILIDHVLSAFDVDGRELTFIFGFQMRVDLGFVNLIAAAGKLLFAVTAFGAGHGRPPNLLNIAD
jgi:hypothetical protein